MKRIPTLLILLSMSLIVFNSCKKDPASNNSNPVSSDSIYLDKLYAIDMTTMDTLLSTVFTYDAQNRVISMASPASAINYTNYTYYYNGTDTLPYKSMLLDKYDTEYDTVITYHYYDNSQRNLKDSVFRAHENAIGDYTVEITVSDYSYVTGKRFALNRYTYLEGGTSVPTGTDTATVDANYNILFSKNSHESFSVPGTYEFNATSSFTFDNHRSPFSLLSNFKAHQHIPNGETLFFEYLSFNNVLTRQESYSGFNETYTYTYGANSLPQVLTITDPVQEPLKIIYKYKSL